MDVLTIVLLIFIALEISNVFMLYFIPETKRGNGVGVFNAYEKSKKDPEIYALVRYLIHWVAGTKLIFIGLLLVIIFKGNDETIYLSTLALIISILTFFWRLYPMIKQMDQSDQITPKGYSKTLGFMIFGFVTFISAALIFSSL
jgi:hypothetical protein